jgi:hypothetical protein
LRPGLLIPLAATVIVCGCSSSGPRSTSPVLLSDVGPGYHVAPASGPLSKDALGSATALPKATMAAYLRRAGWRSATERVWTSSTDGFVTDIVVTFASSADASGLATLASKTLPGDATRPFTPPGVPEARGFVQTSAVDGTTMFCVFAFAPNGSRVFVVTRCTPYPQDTSTVTRLLMQQLARAG